MEAAIDKEQLLAKVEAIAQGPDKELFGKLVDSFFERLEGEYFSPEDLAHIEAGFEEIRQGKTVRWEDLKRELGL